MNNMLTSSIVAAISRDVRGGLMDEWSLGLPGVIVNCADFNRPRLRDLGTLLNKDVLTFTDLRLTITGL